MLGSDVMAPKNVSKYFVNGKGKVVAKKAPKSIAQVAADLSDASFDADLDELMRLMMDHPDRIHMTIKVAREPVNVTRKVAVVDPKEYIHHTLLRAASIPKKEVILASLRRWYPDLAGTVWRTMDKIEGNAGQVNLFCRRLEIEKEMAIPVFCHHKKVLMAVADKVKDDVKSGALTFTEAGGVGYSGDCGVFQLGDAGADGTIAKLISGMAISKAIFRATTG